jgi:hypothetical protein
VNITSPAYPIGDGEVPGFDAPWGAGELAGVPRVERVDGVLGRDGEHREDGDAVRVAHVGVAERRAVERATPARRTCPVLAHRRLKGLSSDAWSERGEGHVLASGERERPASREASRLGRCVAAVHRFARCS